MKNGILKTLIFYGIGFGVAGISYLIIGQTNVHVPGVYHLVLFLTIFIGIIWTLKSIIFFFFKVKTNKLKGIIITNVTILLSCYLYATAPAYSESTENTFIEPDFVRTEIKDDTTELYHNDHLIFIKVKDSVILDLR